MSRQEERREAKRAYWRNVLADWARSGLSKTEYARRHELNSGQLRWWSSHYPHWARRERPAPENEAATAGEEASATRAAPSFVTVQPDAEAAGSAGAAAERRPEPLRLTVGGATVEVPPDFCEQTLERLLGVLERRA